MARFAQSAVTSCNGRARAIPAASVELIRVVAKAPNNELEAYLAGMIAADGWVDRSSGPPKVRLEQKAESRLLMQQLASAFGRNLYTKPNGAVWLEFVNLDPSWKSSTPSLEPELVRHYWRGVIDGDGCITRYVDKRDMSARTELMLYYNPLTGQFWLMVSLDGSLVEEFVTDAM